MAVKFIHTSDWHLGQKLNGFDRSPEHEQFLKWLLERMERNNYDALLVAGDIFDSANPPIAALEQFTRFAVAARQLCPNVIFTAGNHDSAARLEALRPVFSAVGVNVAGGIPVDPGAALIPVKSRDGAVAAQVAAIPFLRPMDLPAGGVMETTGDSIRRIHDGFSAVYAAVMRRYHEVKPALPLVLMGHLYMTGGILTEDSERPVQLEMGKITGVSASVLPPGACYAALGHLHRCQRIAHSFPVHYSGTPVPLTFSEAANTQAVLEVTVDSGKAAVEVIPVPRFLAMADVTGSLTSVLETLTGWVRQGPDAQALLRVTVQLTQPEPDLREQILDIVTGSGIAVLAIRIASPEQPDLPEWLDQGQELEMFTPQDVMALKHRQEFGCDPPEPLAEAFRTLLLELDQETVAE